MNRRGFLNFLGIGAAVAVAAPAILEFAPVVPAPYAATIGMYADYTNFSSFALASAIDDSVAGAAHELAHRAELSAAELSA